MSFSLIARANRSDGAMPSITTQPIACEGYSPSPQKTAATATLPADRIADSTVAFRKAETIADF